MVKNVMIGALAIFVVVGSAFGARPQIARKKSLPLDKLPNAVLKTKEDSHILPGRVIVKLHTAPFGSGAGSTFGVPSVDKFVQRYNAQSVIPLFPARPAAVTATSADDEMSKIYVMKFSSPIDPFQMALEISALPEVDYAEPWFIYQVDDAAVVTPNDSLYSKQWGFAKIQADSAWNVSQGDTSVVIGIVDTGVQWNHPDLNANIWINQGEYGPDGHGGDKSTNGIDDDGNGYVDDWHGADLAGSDWMNPSYDNNPNPVGNNTAHGTHVAGIAGAVTNNTSGVAGIGFKCKILPVKTSADNDTRGDGGSAYIIEGFEGIKYAVDMGAKIINTSWGGGGASQFEQDVINDAVSHGVVVVAAAGNSNLSTPHYPAAYDGVLSVGSTTTTDAKSSFSNFGSTLDVSAPGGIDGGNPALWIMSTYFPNTYAYMSGTSMSSPLAAGLCALVKSVNPSFTGIQAGEQVRVTCDNINAQNPIYADQMGKGRINAYRALTAVSPSVRMTSFTTSDSAGGNNNGALEPGETFALTTHYVNYLQTTASGAMVTLTTSDTTVQIINGVFSLGALATNGIADNSASPFQVSIKYNTPPAHSVLFKLLMSDAGYSDVQLFYVLLNPTFADHNVNNVTATLTNIGRIGYLDITNTYGSGFIYAGVNEIFEGGLLIGYSPTSIVDNVRSPVSSVSQDNDFVSTQIYSMVTPGAYAAQEGSTMYTDLGAPMPNKLGVEVKQYSYAFTTPPDSDYILIRYDIKNTSGATLNGVYAGVFVDWDMQPNLLNNKAVFERGRSFGYAWDTTASNPNPLYCGVRALDSATGYSGLEVSTADISRSGKYSWISSGIVSPSIGGDINMVLSSGPFTIPPNQRQIVAFALVGGKNLPLIRAHADAAKAKWDYLRGLIVNLLPPNLLSPADRSTDINPPLDLAWNTSSGATQYGVQMASDSLFANVVVNATQTETTKTVSGLLGGTTYYWKVSSLSGLGSSAWSEVRRFKTFASANRPAVAIPIHQNPLLPQYVDLYAISDSALQGTPLMRLRRPGNLTDTIALSQISANIYKGSYEFTSIGSDTISVYALALNGLDTTAYRYLQVESFVPGAAVTLKNGDGSASVSFPADAAKEKMFVTMTREEKQSHVPALLGNPYTFGPPREFDRPLRMVFKYDESGLKNFSEQHLAIYKLGSGSAWTPVESWVDPYRKDVVANVTVLGTYAVGYDPTITSHLIPREYALEQNFPNPFNPQTTIRFSLPAGGTATLKIYDVMGQEVAQLMRGQLQPGNYNVSWGGKDASGRDVASGVYFYRLNILEIGTGKLLLNDSKKMLLMR